MDNDILTSSVHYGDVLRRRRELIAIGLVASVVLAALGFLLGGSAGGDPVARATVEVRPVTANRFGSNTRLQDLISMPTEVGIGSSGIIASRVIEDLALDTTSESLVGHLKVINPEGTQLLEFAVTHSSSAQARDLAQSFAEQYVAYRRQDAIETIAGNIAQVEADADAARSQLAEATTARDQAANAAARGRLEAEIVQLNLRLANFEQEVSTKKSIFVDPGSVITKARAEKASNAGGAIPAVGLFGLGLLATLAAVVVTDQRDALPRSVEEIGNRVPGAVLGFTSAARAEAQVDEYHRLRMLLGPQKYNVARLLVVSAGNDGAAGEVAVNLCRAAARSNVAVVLVWNADIESDSALGSLGVSIDKRLDLAVEPPAAVDHALLRVPDHYYMGVLGIPPGTTSVAAPAAYHEMYLRLAQRFALIVTVAPSNDLIEAAELAAHADGSLIAVDAEVVPRSSVEQVAEALAEVNSNVIASFVVRARSWWG